MSNTISVVIPVKNEEKKIVNCLEAVFNQSFPPKEVIVVDGHSSDNTVENALKFPILLRYENYKTVGGARQVGLETAKGDFIAFTDADCIPSKDWLKNLYTSFNEENEDIIMGVGGGIHNIGVTTLERSIFLVFDTYLGSGGSVQDRVFGNKRYIKSFSGCNCMYRTLDLKEVGGYDVRLSLGEDSYIDSKMNKKGKLLYIPDAVVFHDQTLNFSDFIKRTYSFGWGRGKNRFWDIQVIPPVVGMVVFSSLFIYPSVFFIMILVYFIILFGYDIHIYLKKRESIFLLTVPLIFIIEHFTYAIGFWTGLASGLAETVRRFF